jgi:hypothetical protein
MSNVKTVKGGAGKGKGKGTKAPKGAPALHANGAEFSVERPGVLAIIVGALTSAHPRGMTKGAIVDALCKAFPERDRAKMKNTVSMQVPSGIFIEKGYALHVTLRDGAKLFSLATADKSAGDAWRVTRRTDPKGAAKLLVALKARRDALRPQGDEGDE